MKYVLSSVLILLLVAVVAVTDAVIVRKWTDEILEAVRGIEPKCANEAREELEIIARDYRKKEWLLRISFNRERGERARGDLQSALSYAKSGEDAAYHNALSAFLTDLTLMNEITRFSWTNVF